MLLPAMKQLKTVKGYYDLSDLVALSEALTCCHVAIYLQVPPLWFYASFQKL
jgi:hypothetical protein